VPILFSRYTHYTEVAGRKERDSVVFKYINISDMNIEKIFADSTQYISDVIIVMHYHKCLSILFRPYDLDRVFIILYIDCIRCYTTELMATLNTKSKKLHQINKAY
jgi:hypothetical protein